MAITLADLPYDYAALQPVISAATMKLASRIDAGFGGHRQFCDRFKAAAMGVFGSGWVWLVEAGGILEIKTTANADTPIAHGQRPLLVHAEQDLAS